MNKTLEAICWAAVVLIIALAAVVLHSTFESNTPYPVEDMARNLLLAFGLWVGLVVFTISFAILSVRHYRYIERVAGRAEELQQAR